MNNCGNCKHWKRKDDEFDSAYSLGLGQCDSAPELWNCREWNEDGDKDVFNSIGEKANKFTNDGSDYVAKLLTKPAFYCSDWEEHNNP